ncbi:MAG: thioredoxin-disulfide reductase [Bacteroidota bacterium]|nr:thioredoxin-disulfide reductase [Candidatus Kapabacteria bacterium]MDW8218934.1 thioredoxin-disulfide reductase [Bacteroidota bacterium]
MARHNVGIIGSGPAGLTAALYAARANLHVTVFEGQQPGGQLTITTEVENYPGFEHGIQGPELMDVMRKQAQRFGAQSVYETVVRLKPQTQGFILTTERGSEYYADAVIIAMGASAKLLGVKGESEYMGYGISACATCDGFFFRDQHVIVVGGGDTAMEEANYLTRFCASVTIVHRREEFRASKIMLDRARNNPKISFLLNTVVEEFRGETLSTGLKKMTSVVLRNVLDNSLRDMPIDGAFVAIGHQPNTKLVEGLLDLDAQGYVITKGKSTYTNVPGIFACGDVQDAVYRQAVTAAASGCMAAIDAERWLETR